MEYNTHHYHRNEIVCRVFLRLIVDCIIVMQDGACYMFIYVSGKLYQKQVFLFFHIHVNKY